MVKDSVIFSGTVIKENAEVSYCIIDENVTIGAHSSLGIDKELSKGITVVGRDTVIDDYEVIMDDQNIEADSRKGNK